jgi:hypothetical protein
VSEHGGYGDCVGCEELRAERDALKAERDTIEAQRDVMCADNKRLRAELETQSLELRGLAEGYELQLTELREAAEAVQLLGPECECSECEWCGLDNVLAKLTPPPCTCRFDRSDHGWVSKTPCKLHGQKGTP